MGVIKGDTRSLDYGSGTVREHVHHAGCGGFPGEGVGYIAVLTSGSALSPPQQVGTSAFYDDLR